MIFYISFTIIEKKKEENLVYFIPCHTYVIDIHHVSRENKKYYT